MKDELSFYAVDTKTLEEKIMTKDLLMGRELAAELERFGQHLGTLYFDKVYMGDIFKKLEVDRGAVQILTRDGGASPRALRSDYVLWATNPRRIGRIRLPNRQHSKVDEQSRTHREGKRNHRQMEGVLRKDSAR